MTQVSEKLLRYVKVNTRSDENSETTPSTPSQLVFAQMLEKELQKLGLETSLDEKAYLFATLPSNLEVEAPTLGLLAHLDTADFEAENVRPRIIGYEGGEIVLNEEKQIILKLADFPDLSNYIGQDLIVTDGTTLLGADDKAGIAEIMTVVEYLVKHPEVKHPRLRIAFTPDEEVGRGPAHFDVEKFNADFAYTVDGGPLGELEYENFNAASAVLKIQGRNVHPGSAKNKMINSMTLAMEYVAGLPVNEVPEHTEHYEGFYHLLGIDGSVDQTTMHFIIRDHFKDIFEARKQFMQDLSDWLQKKYPNASFQLTIKDSYYNMKEKIEPVMFLIENAKQAMLDCSVEPKITPIRGGTDGAQLSFRGLPTPNLFTGGENYHGRYEFISIQSMEKACEVLLRLVGIYAEKAR